MLLYIHIYIHIQTYKKMTEDLKMKKSSVTKREKIYFYSNLAMNTLTIPISSNHSADTLTPPLNASPDGDG